MSVHKDHSSHKATKRYAIVQSGGSFNCSFGAKVEETLWHHFKFPAPFLRLAASGGAITTSYTSANQYKEGHALLTDNLSDPEIVKKTKWSKKLDINLMIKYVAATLNTQQLLESPTNNLIVATEYNTGRTKYFHSHKLDPKHPDQWLDYLKASICIPGHHAPVQIDGIDYIDGDVGTPLDSLIFKAFSLGAERVIAIDNRSPNEFFDLVSLIAFGQMMIDARVLRALFQRAQFAQRAATKLKPFEKHILRIASPTPLPTRDFNNSSKAIEGSMKVGDQVTKHDERLWKLLKEISE